MDSGKRAADDGKAERGSRPRRNAHRDKGFNAEESVKLANEPFAFHGLEVDEHCKDESRRKSEVRLLPIKATLTTFAPSRRKSTGEFVDVGRQYNGSICNSKPIPDFRQVSFDIAWQNDKVVSVTTTKRNDLYKESESETNSFPTKSKVNHGEKFQLSTSGLTNRREPKGVRLQSDHRTLSTHGEHGLHEKLRFIKHECSSERLQLPDPSVYGEFTRRRSLSDSNVFEGSVLSTGQREKLDRLKHQIYETNLKRRNNYKKVSGGKFEVPYRKQSTESTTSGASTFPVLTEKSLKHHSKSHEMVNWTTDSDQIMPEVSTRSNMFNLTSVTDNRNLTLDSLSTGHFLEPNAGKSDISLDAESSGALPVTSSSLAYSVHSQQVRGELNQLYFPSPPRSEGSDSESISITIERLRARSEPGDVGSRNLSTVEQLHSRARSESDAAKAKVQAFVEKALPAISPSTLRVKRSDGVPQEFGHFKSGAHVNIAPEMREKREGLINIHTCPNLNLFTDQSWLYQDKSRNTHRYIRGPATPVPPVDFVFSDSEHDNS